MADIITIANTDQQVDHKRYDESFVRIFGEPKKGVTGKYVYRDGQCVPKETPGELPASAGNDPTWKKSTTPCLKCHSANVRWRGVEVINGGCTYEDKNYQCDACGHGWWIDGVDSL